MLDCACYFYERVAKKKVCLTDVLVRVADACQRNNTRDKVCLLTDDVGLKVSCSLR